MKILGRAWLFNLGADVYAWFNANELWRASCAHLAAFYPQPNGRRPMRVLDLGCGPGVTALALAEARPDTHIVAVDLAPRMISLAQKQTRRRHLTHNISYVIADAAALPFPPGAFDVATAHSFLYLVDDRKSVLEDAYRVLRGGGVYVSMEPHEGQTKRGALTRHWNNVRYMVSILLWRPYSKYHGRLDEKNFPSALKRAGFKRTGVELALDGLGIIGHGEK